MKKLATLLTVGMLTIGSVVAQESDIESTLGETMTPNYTNAQIQSRVPGTIEGTFMSLAQGITGNNRDYIDVGVTPTTGRSAVLIDALTHQTIQMGDSPMLYGQESSFFDLAASPMPKSVIGAVAKLDGDTTLYNDEADGNYVFRMSSFDFMSVLDKYGVEDSDRQCRSAEFIVVEYDNNSAYRGIRQEAGDSFSDEIVGEHNHFKLNYFPHTDTIELETTEGSVEVPMPTIEKETIDGSIEKMYQNGNIEINIDNNSGIVNLYFNNGDVIYMASPQEGTNEYIMPPSK